ncbi:MAG: hypothetical protein IKB06_02175 [Clostridia bacterium]|nr:hypothetical protein [Clostridia bacterium]
MSIIIKLQEKNNKLLFSDTPIALLCGNSNYQLNIDFDEDWSRFSTKTAVFSINCKNHLVEFSGNTVDVPCLPNCHNMNFYVMCSDENLGQRTTNTLSFDLIPTKAGFSDEVFDNANNYLSQLKSLLNSIETGTYVIPKAIHAESADVANNVSNPNLLINGNFKVNQRGESTYSTAGRYTVDRWRLVSGSVSVASNGIVLNGTISQTLEHTPTEIVTPSVDNTAGGVSCSYSNGVFKITATNKLVKWAKLEIGTTPTPFSPRPYAEELAMCQRYYQVYYGYKKASNGYQYYEPNVSHKTPMRTIPTKKMFAVNGYSEISSNENSAYDITSQAEITVTIATFGYANQHSFTLANGNGTFVKDHEYRFVVYCDAELY